MMGNKKRRISLVIILGMLLALSLGVFLYINDYYHADQYALEALESTDEVTIYKLDSSSTYIFEPKKPTLGLIFYPGGKVEYTAYAPLMREFASHGILCILPKMPANLAVLNPNAADNLKEHYPDIRSWYIGGHSLGGSMAAKYVSEHLSDYDGLLLLASYSTIDLSDSGLSVISIYGSNDRVLNYNNYNKYSDNLPHNTYEYVIDGGCHAYFGSYGTQRKDGIPSISPQEQIKITVEEFLRNPFVKLFGYYNHRDCYYD